MFSCFVPAFVVIDFGVLFAGLYIIPLTCWTLALANFTGK